MASSRGQVCRRKYDYIHMRIIRDELYARLVKILAQDEKVAVFQQLLLSQKAEPTDEPDKIETESEVK